MLTADYAAGFRVLCRIAASPHHGELAKLVRERAASLHATGVRHGDTVALVLPDSAGHVIAFYALARVGAIIFSLPNFVSRRDIEESLASVSVDAVIAPQAKISASATGPQAARYDYSFVRITQECDGKGDQEQLAGSVEHQTEKPQGELA